MFTQLPFLISYPSLQLQMKEPSVSTQAEFAVQAEASSHSLIFEQFSPSPEKPALQVHE